MYGSPYEINTVSLFFAFSNISFPSSTNHLFAVLNSPPEISSSCFFSVSEIGLVKDSKYTISAFFMTSSVLSDNSEIPEIPNPINHSIISFYHAVFLNGVVIFSEFLFL